MIEVYTRKETCLWCNNALHKLHDAGYTYKELVIGDDISRNDFIQKFYPNETNPRPTAPQISINNVHIGGYEDLLKWLEQNQLT